MKGFLKDNKGVSLIELLIVIAILTVLGGLTAFSYRMVSTRTASQCAENMKITLEKNRTTVMGKKNGRIAFFRDASGAVWVQEEYDYADAFSIDYGKASKIGRQEVEVTFNGVALSTTPVIIEFKRSGALKSGSDNLPIIVKKNSRVYKITIDSLTGKITMKRQ